MLGEGPSSRSGLKEEVPEDILAEQDAEARAAEEELLRHHAGG